jgi:hypothetical protein
MALDSGAAFGRRLSLLPALDSLQLGSDTQAA